MQKSAQEVFIEYLTAQDSGDIDKVMQLILDDAIFDVGRGRYTGAAIRQFHERLQSISSTTLLVKIDELEPDHVIASLDQSDDDLKPLGLDKIRLEADIYTSEGKIRLFTARPDSTSLALIASARDAGRPSEGTNLADGAGNLPPKPNIL